MSHYFDIELLPDPEFQSTTLMNALFAKFHKALHDINSTSIGVSFPDYKVLLGNIIRLHGAEADLANFLNIHWLGGLAGYCEASAIKPAPDGVKHRTVSRWQHNMSESQLRRLVKRAQKRGESLSEEEIKSYRAKMFKAQLTELPYIEMQSSSNGHKHRRYIEFGELLDEAVSGKFDTFGLSKTATVPWF